MPLASTTAAHTLIGLASKFQEFFYSNAADVTFEYMNEDGERLTTTVPNVAKVTADLRASAVTDEELTNALKANPYEDVEVEITYVGSPRYRIEVIAPDYKSGEEVFKKVADKAIEYMEKYGGEGKFYRE